MADKNENVTASEAAKALGYLTTAIVPYFILAGLVAWGIQPLFQLFGFYPQFWALFFTAVFITRLASGNARLAHTLNTYRSDSK